LRDVIHLRIVHTSFSSQEVMGALAESGQPLSAKQVGEVMVALLRASRPLAAFDTFEAHLEKATIYIYT